ncbi:hypothetical protein [Microbacterium azadirachtae]|uniref:hypothetical protein n=1 Tax=Microbacterium azadirachtae TaxID=582680 RepID=UPI003F756406
MTNNPAPIDPDQFDDLNLEFYAADPAEVIQHRLWMIAQFVTDDSAGITNASEELAMEREVPSQPDRVQFASRPARAPRRIGTAQARRRSHLPLRDMGPAVSDHDHRHQR